MPNIQCVREETIRQDDNLTGEKDIKFQEDEITIER